MPYINIPLASNRITHLILHHDNSSGTALTIDGPSKTFLEEVYGLFSTMDGNEIYNHDDGAGALFHDQLHLDMQAVMNTNLAGTLTDYHQHWVSREYKGSKLLFGHAKDILQKFKQKNWISGTDFKNAIMQAYTG